MVHQNSIHETSGRCRQNARQALSGKYIMNKAKKLMPVVAFFMLIACSQTAHQSPSALEWKVDGDGWVLQKGLSGKKFEKFFAIGTWHVPGYVFTDSEEADDAQYQRNASLFQERTAPIQLVFVTPGLQKAYMSDKIHVLNPFSPMLHKFLDQRSGITEGKDKDYYRNRYLEKMVDSPEFEEFLDTEIRQLLDNLPNDKYIFSHIDEIAMGGVSRWAIPPAAGAKITERLKLQHKNALVFVDLLGHAKGSTYLFEKKYLQTHDALPPDPPYDLATPGALESTIPLLGFFHSYNGLPVYQFIDGNYSYTTHGYETLKSIWYENAKLIAEGYKTCGDVFGINAFGDFRTYPALAGVTVDALRAGLGEGVPVWLYFDGNGYAKPANVTPEAYIELVKCQIYTAIIHGATGIMFWNDWHKTPEVFDALLPMLKELNDNMDIIKLKTLETKVDGDLHVMIKKEKGKKYVIASNTNKSEALPLNRPGIQKQTLNPLEVYISDF